MTNTYRPLSELGKATYGDEVVALDLSAMDEKDALDAGHLELVPRAYTVLSNNFSGGPQGAEYVGALRVEIEQALIQGGHLQRVDAKEAGADGEPSSFKETRAEGGRAAAKNKKED